MADSGGGGGGVDWADLPLDAFSLIFSKLSLPQFIRSAAVCVSWSAAARDLSTRGNCFKFRGQSPWLVLYNNPHGDPSAVTFYALDERREYTIPIPDPPIIDRLFLGSAHGWIITIDVRFRMQLLNPITGAQIDLPRVLPSGGTHPILNTEGRLIGFMMQKPVNEVEVRRGMSYVGGNWCLEQHHLKAILSADPSLGDGYTVAFIQYPYRRIIFTRCGDEQWLDLRNPISVEIENIVFHKGKLYMSTLSEVYVCDLDEMPRFRVVDRALHRDDLHYLLDSPRGDLLSIWRERNENHTKTISVKVYRVIDDEEKPSERLEKTMDLGEFIISLGGDRVVVDDDKESLSIRLEAKNLGNFTIILGGCNALCLSASDFPHLTPNSIYFTDDDIIRYPKFAAQHRMPISLERHWFRKILNCRIGVDNTFVRLYWQPPSSFVDNQLLI